MVVTEAYVGFNKNYTIASSGIIYNVLGLICSFSTKIILNGQRGTNLLYLIAMKHEVFGAIS